MNEASELFVTFSLRIMCTATELLTSMGTTVERR